MRGRDNRWSRGGRGGNRRGGFNRGGPGRGGGSRGNHRGRGYGDNRNGNRYSSNNQWNNIPKSDTPGLRLSEDQIGVTEYMSEHEGFNGIIKSRYSDFQVSEINLQGEVAQLTTLEPPEAAAEELVEEDEELLLTKYNVEILPMDTWDRINKVAVGEVSEAVEIDVTTSSKEERTKIHEAVKKAFGDCIVGSTVNNDDKKIVRFVKYKKGVRVDNRVKWTWPSEYVHFVVHKENCDTMEAASKIAERLRSHIRPSMMGYAGTKDRRAKTTQWFSLRKIDPRKISRACAGMRELSVGNFSFHDHQLKLGMLKGNKFRIALRNVTSDDAAVEAACSRLAERGFINYYGLQRFGTRVEVPTFLVGMKLLKGNFQEAIDGILQERSGPLARALSAYRSRGACAAATLLPRHCVQSVEARVLHSLNDAPNDLCLALQRVPRNTRLLYLHSYQSMIWNRCVSERLRKHGLTPVVGDLVPLQPHQIKEETEDEESDNEETIDNADTIDNEEQPTQTIHIKTEDKTETPKKKQKNQVKEKVPVKVLTQEDIDSKKYTIFDIIMPLPGYLIDYPPNMKDYYETLLSNDGLTLELKHKNKNYSLSGAYRLVAIRPRDVTWQCVKYSDPYTDLILSDLDLLRGRTLDGIREDGTYKALLLNITLPPSCYATMALRELLRADTSGQNQSLQNNYHKRKNSEQSEGGEKRVKEET